MKYLLRSWSLDQQKLLRYLEGGSWTSGMDFLPGLMPALVDVWGACVAVSYVYSFVLKFGISFNLVCSADEYCSFSFVKLHRKSTFTAIMKYLPK